MSEIGEEDEEEGFPETDDAVIADELGGDDGMLSDEQVQQAIKNMMDDLA